MADNKRVQFLNRVSDMTNKHLYMSATKLSNTLTIGGAGNKFRRDPDIIYVPKYRLVGYITDILSVIKSYNLDTDLGDYYTANNYTKSKAYAEEVNARKLYQESLKKNDQDQVLDLINNIDKCRIRLPSIFDKRPNNKSSRGKRTKVQAQSQVQDTEDTVEENTEPNDVVQNESTVQDDGFVEEIAELTDSIIDDGTVQDTIDDEDTVVLEEDTVQDADTIDDEDTVSVHTDEDEKEQTTHIIEDVRMDRPKSPKKYPIENRTRLNKSTPIAKPEVQTNSTRTRLAPISTNVPVSKYSEESSSRRRLRPIIN